MKKFETFRKISDYSVNQMTQKSPSCFNGNVEVEKYNVIIEKITEEKEVYRRRLQELWDKCHNYHHWTPLRDKAKELGVELAEEPGSKEYFCN